MEPTSPIRKAYPSDLRDGEWAILEPLVPAVKPGGRPARHSRREIVNAILYVVRGGNQWRAMPHDLPPWQTAFYYFRIWRNDGTWERIHTALRERTRRHLGTRGDAQRGDPGQPVGQDQAKGGPRGFDAHKQVKGRKRHLLVDTQGFVLKVVVSAADVQDRDGARLLAHAVRLYGPELPRLSLVWADAGYAGPGRGRPAPADGLDAGGGQALRPAAAQHVCRAAAPLDRRAHLQLVGRAAPARARTTSTKSSPARRSSTPA